MAVTINGTTGITTPDIDSAGADFTDQVVATKTSAGASTNALVVRNLDNTAGTAASIGFAAHGSGTETHRLEAEVDGANSYSMRFYTYQSGLNERMRIDSSGHVTMSGQPAFLALHGGGDSVTNATSYTIPFNNEKFDQGGDFSSTTFTAPVTGRYAFHAFARVDAGGSSNTRFSELQLQLTTSNRTVTNSMGTTYTNADDRMGIGLSVLVDMDANDTASLSVFCSRYGASGATTTVGNTTNPDTYFSGHLVC